jgi:single-strand DNA-binding protein
MLYFLEEAAMPASYNRVMIMGNITRDVELRLIPSGTAVADITVAVNDRRKQGDEYVEDTQFVDVTLWARTAEIVAEYCQKGSPVFIEGRLKLDKWEADDGSNRSKLKVVAERVQLLSSRNGGGERQPASSGETAPVGAPAANADGEIPF